MQSHRILVVTSEPGAPGSQTFWEALAERWPRGLSRPEAVELDLTRLLDGPDPVTAFSVLDAAVVRVPEGIDPARLLCAAERLREQNVGALFLVPDAVAAREAIGGAGVVFHEHTVDPAVGAAVLAALAERHAQVRELEGSLRAAHRLQRGAAAELERLNEDLKIAAAVQREFLPKKLPAIAGFDLGVLYRPAGYVSGDIYDAVVLDERHVGLLVADLSGHGVSAALLSMILSRAMPMVERTRATTRIVPPAEALARLNQLFIARQGELPCLATAVYALVDVRTRAVVLASAGHPPALRVTSGAARPVDLSGPLLGLSANDEFDSVSFTMGPGETLVLYTDGLERAFPDPPGMTGGLPVAHVEAMARLVGDNEAGGPAAAMASLSDLLDAQSGSLHQYDDITALAFGPCAAAAELRDAA